MCWPGTGERQTEKMWFLPRWSSGACLERQELCASWRISTDLWERQSWPCLRVLEERSQKVIWNLQDSGMSSRGGRNGVPGSGNSMCKGPSVRNHLAAYLFHGLKGNPWSWSSRRQSREQQKGVPENIPSPSAHSLLGEGDFILSTMNLSLLQMKEGHNDPLNTWKERITPEVVTKFAEIWFSLKMGRICKMAAYLFHVFIGIQVSWGSLLESPPGLRGLPARLLSVYL